MAIKNFWSLQVGEVIIADLIKQNLGKNYEVFIPLNNQLKNVDLAVMNLKTKKAITIQVKESREYTLGKANGWMQVRKQKILDKVVDFYIFVVYTAQDEGYKMKMQVKTLVVPSMDLLEKSKNKHESNGNIGYYFSFNGNKASEHRDKPIQNYSRYIDNFDLLRI